MIGGLPLAQRLNDELNGQKWPPVSSAVVDGGVANVSVEIAPSLLWFQGHFPDYPVLPGVVQVHWAVEYARRLFDIEQVFQKVENLKFKAVVFPEMQVDMQFEYDPGRRLVRFVFGDGETVFSEGRITFADD